MERSDQIDALAKALHAFQSDIKTIEHNDSVIVKSQRTNTQYTFTYATLDHIVNTIKPHMSQHGLTFTQLLEDGGITTMLIHTSGQYLSTFTPLGGSNPDRNSMQDWGAMISYARRYALSSILGIVTDQDGEQRIEARREKPKQQKRNTKQRTNQGSDKQKLPAKARFINKMTSEKIATKDCLEEAGKLFGVTAFDELSDDQFRKLHDHMIARKS